MSVSVDFDGHLDALSGHILEKSTFKNEAYSDFGHTLWLVSPLLRRMNVQLERHVERCGCHTQAQQTNTNTHTNIPSIQAVS